MHSINDVMAVWQKAQANWYRLVPIFMQSDDIRSQLPDNAKRLEQLDNSRKELMQDASRSDLAVEVRCAEGRQEKPKYIQDGITTCEKSLNEYLEQKKTVFIGTVRRGTEWSRLMGLECAMCHHHFRIRLVSKHHVFFFKLQSVRDNSMILYIISQMMVTQSCGHLLRTSPRCASRSTSTQIPSKWAVNVTSRAADDLT